MINKTFLVGKVFELCLNFGLPQIHSEETKAYLKFIFTKLKEEEFTNADVAKAIDAIIYKEKTLFGNFPSFAMIREYATSEYSGHKTPRELRIKEEATLSIGSKKKTMEIESVVELPPSEKIDQILRKYKNH